MAKHAKAALPVARTLKGEILPPAHALAEPTKFKFTARKIESLPAPHPSGKQRLYWDTELTGFGLLVSGTTNSKSFVVQRKLAGGQTRRVTIGPTTVVDDLDEARTKAKDILKQFYAGIDPKAARREATRGGRQITLRAALDSYLTNKRKKGGGELREKTKKDYRASMERHLADWLDKPLRDITPEMILERHAEIQDNVDLGPKKNSARSIKYTGNATANGVMVALRAVWNFNAKPGRIPDLPTNPVGALDNSWFATKRRTRHVEDKDLPAFYKAVNALPSRVGSDYIKLLLFSGFRRGEAAQLEWDHLDFDERAIHIPENMTKTGEPLDLPMTDFVYDLLKARRELGREGKYVFPANSKRGHLEEPKFFLAQVAEATGIRVSPHDLRRTFTTAAESTEMSPWALKRLINHATGDDDVTGGYVQLKVKRLREPAQRVADKIKTLCGILGQPKARPKKTGRATA